MKIRRMMETTPHKEYGKTPSHKGMKKVWNVSSWWTWEISLTWRMKNAWNVATWIIWEVSLTWGYEEWLERLHVMNMGSLPHMRTWRMTGSLHLMNMGSLPHMRVWRMMGTSPHEEYGKSPSHEGTLLLKLIAPSDSSVCDKGHTHQIAFKNNSMRQGVLVTLDK
jgi:hypothetical protein